MEPFGVEESDANLKFLRFAPPSSSMVQMVRKSLLGPVFESRFACADQMIAGCTLPVTESILFATTSPSHMPVRNVELKSKLSVCVMFGLDVAEADAAAVATLSAARAV